jgi:hypothetical protein
MKNLIEINGIRELNDTELLIISGDGFWGDLAFAAGYLLHSIYVIGTVGGAYQQSLPSALKK